MRTKEISAIYSEKRSIRNQYSTVSLGLTKTVEITENDNPDQLLNQMIAELKIKVQTRLDKIIEEKSNDSD